MKKLLRGDGRVANMLKFSFIFIIIVAAVCSVTFSGIINEEDPISTTDSSIDTPWETSHSTHSTEYTYPPATVPTGISHTTENTTLSPKPPVDPDITDEAMAKLITKKYLSIRPLSRPGEKLTAVKNIVVHYVANPNTSAAGNWNYFETQKDRYASAHFIIGLDGEILQLMPLDEVAWAVGVLEGNYTSISIECCHPDNSGKFSDATYQSLIKLVSWLCNKFELDKNNVKRHYDYTGKLCPIYFVENPAEWEKFKNSLLIN